MRTFAQKVLERASGATDLRPGDIVEAEPDLYMSHSASWRCIKTLERLPGATLAHPERIAMVMDHISPARTAKTAGHHRLCREFAAEHGIETFYDVEAGISHLVLMENGHVRPGQLIIGTDSHSTIYGAVGALGTGVGFSEITATWVTGKLWMRVPESIKVVVRGRLEAPVSAKDLMLRLIGDLTADGATYCSVEFHGDHVRALPVSQRMTLCNLAMELGAKNAFVPPDALTAAYLEEAGAAGSEPLLPDEDAEYARTVEVDCDDLAPQISCPHTVDNVRPIDEVAGTHVDQVFIGSCANAKHDDLVEAASFLRGHRVAPGVRLVVTPGSREVLARVTADGTLSTFIEAGALVTNPGCGACAGDGGVMADGEVTLSTANRNFQGRMGSYDAEIYLSSPAVAAASAVRGAISDPRGL
jgi:3-isopropylmalate/(R)-2-methylmalate dehydratase large subunit